MVVKPTLARGFNYKDMHWADLPQVQTAKVSLAPEIEGSIAFRMRSSARSEFSRR
jgi:hypothetical protein